MKGKSFLGRNFFNENTMTWEHIDGSVGRLPDEMRIDVECATERRIGEIGGNSIFILGTIFMWKERLKSLTKSQ